MGSAVKAKICPEMQQLSEYVSRALSKALPRDVVERAKVHLLDTVCSMVSGSRLEAGRVAISYVKTQGGKPDSKVIGARLLTSAPLAALANGMMAHADETDDTHPASNTHPGRGVVPAVLALADRNHSSGMELLRAMMVGYDVCARVPLVLGPIALMRRGHYTGAFGSIFGAAAGSAALLRLKPAQIRHVLSLTTQQASGLAMVLRGADHVEKGFAGGGMPAHNGAAAALMVAAGFTGVDDVFTGDPDFFGTFAEKPARQHIARNLGGDYEIFNCAIKCWASGGPTQGPLHVLKELIDRHDIKAGDVAEIIARMPDNELRIVNNRSMPNICVQHLLAVMLLDGTLTFSTSRDAARMKDAKVLAVRKHITAVGDPSLTDSERRWRCVMTVKMKDGREFHHQTMAAKGSYENPVSRKEEEEKAMDLMGSVLGNKRAKAVVDAIWSIDKLRDVRSLRTLI